MPQTVDLFTPLQLGPYSLKNRLVMAPLTRNRAGVAGIPGEMNALYYRQRAGAGLILTEATCISPGAVGYPATPGIWNGAQVGGWSRVTEAVHGQGGRIFCQLWHVGRVSHPSLLPEGELPVAPSAVRPAGEAFTYSGMQPFVTPRALDRSELAGIVESYRVAARNALAAGFDGVEVHAANGYLLDQFLNSTTNRRTDGYGGSIENRARLLLEVVEAVSRVCGADRVGVRISPLGVFNDMGDEDPEALFAYLAEQLSALDLAYLHVVDPSFGGHQATEAPDPRGLAMMAMLRERYTGTLMVCGGYTLERAQCVIQNRQADLVAFGRLFIANPDLPERFREAAALNTPDPDRFYGGGLEGYVDYPTLRQQRGEEGLPDFSVLEAG